MLNLPDRTSRGCRSLQKDLDRAGGKAVKPLVAPLVRGITASKSWCGRCSPSEEDGVITWDDPSKVSWNLLTKSPSQRYARFEDIDSPRATEDETAQEVVTQFSWENVNDVAPNQFILNSQQNKSTSYSRLENLDSPRTSANTEEGTSFELKPTKKVSISDTILTTSDESVNNVAMSRKDPVLNLQNHPEKPSIKLPSISSTLNPIFEIPTSPSDEETFYNLLDRDSHPFDVNVLQLSPTKSVKRTTLYSPIFEVPKEEEEDNSSDTSNYSYEVIDFGVSSNNIKALTIAMTTKKNSYFCWDKNDSDTNDESLDSNHLDVDNNIDTKYVLDTSTKFDDDNNVIFEDIVEETFNNKTLLSQFQVELIAEPGKAEPGEASLKDKLFVSIVSLLTIISCLIFFLLRNTTKLLDMGHH